MSFGDYYFLSIDISLILDWLFLLRIKIYILADKTELLKFSVLV